MIKFTKLGITMKPLENNFGCFARFNPGIVVKDNIIHMLYRATNSNIQDKLRYVSSIGYSKLDMNNNILYDSNKSVIFSTCVDEVKGCEDPRIVEFEGIYYIFYTAFDGYKTRVSISITKDFVNYTKLGIINNAFWDKDAFIFPERIGGRIIYIHRISPNIQLDSFGSFDELLSKDYWFDYTERVEEYVVMKPKFEWESQKIGGSIPPIKTDKGWLFLYHGVDNNLVYRSSVVLLDLKNPFNVLSRIPYPLLEPTEDYELYGDVNNVVFPSGGYIYKGVFYIYYGTADKYIGCAKIELNELLNELEYYKEQFCG